MNQRGTARRAVEQAEQKVQELERKIGAHTEALAAADLYATPDGTAKAKGLARELEAMKGQLQAAYDAWEAASAEAERLGAS